MASKQNHLFLYCKSGSFEDLQRLVEDSDVDLNARDRWDNTPLYYACLCGHHEIVEFLLKNGSRCPENTFDGERCLYGALTDEIKLLVKNCKQVQERDRYYELMTLLRERHQYSDVTFVVHGDEFRLHKCILAARFQHFAEKFALKWQRSPVTISNERVTSRAFRAVVQYVYTGRLDIVHEGVAEVKLLACKFKLELLLEEIHESERRIYELGKLKPLLRSHVRFFSVESARSRRKLRQQLRLLADRVIPTSANGWIDYGVLPFSGEPDSTAFYADVLVLVEQHTFYAHRAFLCCYSEYFRARLDDHFGENALVATGHQRLPLVHLRDVSVVAFKAMVLHAYADAFECADVDEALELLDYARMLLVPALSQRCCRFLAERVDIGNVFALYRSAKFFECERLEQRCTLFMALHLDRVVELDEFSQLVLDGAAAACVQERHLVDEADSLVDDIRFQVSVMCEGFGDLEESMSKLRSLDALMSRLGIEDVQN